MAGSCVPVSEHPHCHIVCACPFWESLDSSGWPALSRFALVLPQSKRRNRAAKEQPAGWISPSKHFTKMQRGDDGASTYTRDEQCSSSDDAQQGDALHTDRSTSELSRKQHRENEQVTGATNAPFRRSDGRDWSARICASIARLMEIDGISMDSKGSTNREEKTKAKAAEQAFNERVDRLEAATTAAHKKHWDRLQDMYSASTAKKMRLTSAKPSRTTMAVQTRYDNEALAALAMAAAPQTQLAKEQDTCSEDATTKMRQFERLEHLLDNSMALGDVPGDTAGSRRKPVQVHDPGLTQAVGKLTDKLMQLLVQHQLASDAAAAEPILAAAAAIALEATEMQRREKVALERMTEIEEHRLEIMQGLVEYEKRKEKREKRRGRKRRASD
uniref:Uncharacterized protein n=1 Tax=Peronospora matthiolae TaxID=2874970 RepID=A0AAV1T5L6_9STRA